VSYQNLEFIDGHELPAVDLNQMVENDDCIRAEAAVKPIVTGNLVSQGFGLNYVSLLVKVDGVTNATIAGLGPKKEGNISLSAVTVGIHTLTLTVNCYSSGDDTDFDFHFYKTPDLDYLTVWFDAVESSVQGLEYDDDPFNVLTIKGLTVLGHRLWHSW